MKKVILTCMLTIFSIGSIQCQTMESPVCYAYGDSLTLKYKFGLLDGKFFTFIRLINRSEDNVRIGDKFLIETKGKRHLACTVTEDVENNKTAQGFYPFEVDGSEMKAMAHGIKSICMVRNNGRKNYDLYIKKAYAKHISKRVMTRIQRRAAKYALVDGPKQEFKQAEYARKMQLKEERTQVKIATKERVRAEKQKALEQERAEKKANIEAKIKFETEKRAMLQKLAEERAARKKEEQRQQEEKWSDTRNNINPSWRVTKYNNYPSWRD